MGALRDLAARLRGLQQPAPQPSTTEPLVGAAVVGSAPATPWLPPPPPPQSSPPPPMPPQPVGGWGLSETDRTAALARLVAASPAVAWWALPYGAERGRAFAQARREPGACPNCAARRWWCEAGEPDTALRCATCHPPDHLLPGVVREDQT